MEGTLTLTNSILAGNLTDSDSNPDLFARDGTTALHSLIGNNRDTGLAAAPVGSPDANGNLIGTNDNPIDPQLDDLTNNGRPTRTHAPLLTSPTLEAGDPDQAGTTDQRGRARDATPTIGAIEAFPNNPPTVSDQTLSTNEDTPLAIVLVGDDGVDGVDQSLKYALVDGPSQGVLQNFNDSTGQLTYVPNANFNGTDSFTVTVTDDNTLDGPDLQVPLPLSPFKWHPSMTHRPQRTKA